MQPKEACTDKTRVPKNRPLDNPMKKKTFFVAVIAGDFAHVSQQAQIVIILPQEFNGEVFERLWGFFNTENQSAEEVFKCILEQLAILLKRNEQMTFGGAHFMEGKKSGVQ